MKIRKCYLLFLTVLALLAACATPKALEYRGVENIYIQGLSLEQSQIGLDIRFYNPNPYQLELKSGNIDIYINDHYLGNSSVQTLTVVPRENNFLLPLRLNASLKGILQGALSLLTKQEVNVKLAGNIKAGRNGLFVNIPVNAVTRQVIQIK